jgi:prepilin-type N-terminal cleavage/methylation domain-containing protein
MFSMSMVGRRKADPRGFTLLEVLVSLAVLGIIMTPLAMSFITALKQSDELQRNVGASADAQRIAAAWTQDVQNVDENGVTYDSSQCSDGKLDQPGSGVYPLVSFQWDTLPSTVDPGAPVVAKSSLWALRGSGTDSELVRYYCENGVFKGPESGPSPEVIASSFWDPDVATRKSFYGTSYNASVPNFCSATACTITVDANFYYRLTVQRRVAGLEPPGLTTPPAPSITGGVCGNTELTVAWLPSIVPAGVPPVDAYSTRVTDDALGNSTVASHPSLNGAALSDVFTGLQVNHQYWVIISAHNSNGNGPESEPFGPITCNPVAPDAPDGVSAVRGDQQITVSWNAVGSDHNGGGTVTSYRVRTKIASTDELVSSVVVAGGNTTSTVVTGLENGTAVKATVSAINSAGEGGESAPSNIVTPCGVPYAPGEYVISDPNNTPDDPTDDVSTWTPRAPTTNDAGQQQTKVTYLAPFNNGCQITNYRVYARSVLGGGLYGPVVGSPWTSSTDATSFTTPQLSNLFQYQFQVAAINEVGEGALSPWSAEQALRGVPTTAPGNLAWTPEIGAPDPDHGWPNGNSGGLLTWTPLPDTPPFNNGLSITNYRVDITPQMPGNTAYYLTNGANSDRLDTANLPQIKSGTTFPNEQYQTYAMSVAAKNDAGLGPAATLNVIPGGRPIASPGNVQSTALFATPSSAAVRLTWDVLDDIVQNNGGKPIIGYTVIGGPTASTTYDIDNLSNNFANYGGLNPGQTYTFKIAARNSLGRSIPSTSITVVAPTVLTAPSSTNVVLARPAGTVGNRLSLTFPAFTASSGTPTPVYSAVCSAGGEPNQSFPNLTPGTNILDSPALTNGKAWSCTVTGVVTYYDGSTSTASAASSGTAVPATTPGAPGTPTVAALAAGKARISWTAPVSNGGSAITGYTITSSPALTGFPATVGGSTLTFDTPNPVSFGTTYTFTVVATNVAGNGPGATSAGFSASSSLPTQAPTNLTWTPVYSATQPAQVTISWTPVPDTSPANGGSALTGQVLTLSPAPTSGSATVTLPIGQSSYTYTTNQTSGSTLVNYTATIYATNGNGNGPSATTGAVVHSGGKPMVAVTGISSQPYAPNGAIRLNWTPITNGAQQNGGKSVDGYNIYWSSGGGPESAPYFVSGYSQTGSALGGFTPGVAYTFRVVANNQGGAVAGDSVVSATIVVVSPGPPISGGTPSLTVPVGISGQLRLTFGAMTVNSGSPPLINGPGSTTPYTATCTSSNGGATVNFVNLGSSPTINTLSGLTPLKTYTCALTATNGPFITGNGTTTVTSNSATTL